jgi:hypothetical protein
MPTPHRWWLDRITWRDVKESNPYRFQYPGFQDRLPANLAAHPNLADGVGFEPTPHFTSVRLSKPLQSTSLPPVHMGAACRVPPGISRRAQADILHFKQPSYEPSDNPLRGRDGIGGGSASPSLGGTRLFELYHHQPVRSTGRLGALVVYAAFVHASLRPLN